MHLEALTNDGRKLFSFFAKLSPEFYLAGGTALALQIGHRVSVDFDFFSDDYISKELLGKVKKVFSDFEVLVSVNNPDELTVFAGGIKVTFLRYTFPVIEKLAELDGVKVLDAAEIAATKAYTIGRRGSLKDYVDVYFALRDRITTLDDILELAEKKYGSEFNSRLFLEQLVYLEDVPEVEVNFLKEPVNKKQLEEFFISEVKKVNL